MNLEEMLSIGSIPTILPNFAYTALFETKIAKNGYFLTGIDFNLLSMQKDVKCPRICFSIKRFTKGKIFTSCFNFDQNWSTSEEKKCPEDVSLRKQPFLLSLRLWGRPLQAAGSIFGG